MVTETVLSEIAEAEAAGLRGEDIANLRGAVEGAAAMGMGMSYHVSEADKAAWVAAWRIELDYAGLERGKPVPLPKDRLGYYLSKRREVDGGRLFTLTMPERLAGERKFQCFIVPNVCAWRSDTKSNLIDHMENCHPRESQNFKKQIDQIRDAANSENTALNSLIADIVNTPDAGAMVVPAKIREQYDETTPDESTLSPGVEQVISMAPVHCDLCPWTPDPAKSRPQAALRMHLIAKHKEVE